MIEARLPHYMEKLKAMYPDFDEKTLKKIIIEGCKNMVLNARNNDPVLIDSSKKKVKFLLHNYNKSEKDNK